VELERQEGLSLIPSEILSKGAGAAVQHLLESSGSSQGEPTYHSKIMVIGGQGAGKTTLLDCLFPLTGNLFQNEGSLLGKEARCYFFVLQGKYLMKFTDPSSFYSSKEPLEEVELDEPNWKVEEKTVKGAPGIVLYLPDPSGRKEKAKLLLEFFAETAKERDQWLFRLRRTINPSSTLGVDIRVPQISSHPTVVKEMKERKEGTKDQGEKMNEGREGREKEGNLELSVWDFSGRAELREVQERFLTAKGVFLLVYRLDKEEEGEGGKRDLDLWIEMLASKVDPWVCNQQFSIIIVGTFLDRLEAGRGKGKQKRANEAKQICLRHGLDVGLQYHEVSCSTLDAIQDVEDALLFSIFGHSYLGESTPRSYLVLEQVLEGLQFQRDDFPLAEVQEIMANCQSRLPLDPETVKRGLSVLSLWGNCLYFDFPSRLSETVILNPTLWAQKILSPLLAPSSKDQEIIKQGILRHQDLPRLWQLEDGTSLEQAEKLVAILEQLQVLSILEPDRNKPFDKQRSLVFYQLPEKPAQLDSASFRMAWPKELPFNRPVEIERVLKFSVLPGFLACRILALLYPWVQDFLLWKNEAVVLRKGEGSQAWIRAEKERKRLILVIRGRSLSDCNLLLKWLESQLREMSKRLNFKWSEQIRSPYCHHAEVELGEALKDHKRAREERSLVCPVTLFPLDSTNLLIRAGILEDLTLRKGILIFSPSFSISASFPSLLLFTNSRGFFIEE